MMDLLCEKKSPKEFELVGYKPAYLIANCHIHSGQIIVCLLCLCRKIVLTKQISFVG